MWWRLAFVNSKSLWNELKFQHDSCISRNFVGIRSKFPFYLRNYWYWIKFSIQLSSWSATDFVCDWGSAPDPVGSSRRWIPRPLVGFSALQAATAGLKHSPYSPFKFPQSIFMNNGHCDHMKDWPLIEILHDKISYFKKLARREA